MNTKYLILITLFSFVSFSLIAQNVNFISLSDKFEDRDSLYIELNSRLVYNYFESKYDSMMFISFTNEKYKSIVSVDNKNNNGYYKVFCEGKIVCKYEVLDNEISGIGHLYDNLLMILLKRKLLH